MSAWRQAMVRALALSSFTCLLQDACLQGSLPECLSTVCSFKTAERLSSRQQIVICDVIAYGLQLSVTFDLRLTSGHV